MKTMLNISGLAFLLLAAPGPSYAMMEIVEVTKERAQELGMIIRVKQAGPAGLRMELEFAPRGELKHYTRVDMEIRDREKSWVFATLREEQTSPGHVLVSFAASLDKLDKITLRVVMQSAPLQMTGYEIRVKDFVDVEKTR